MTEKFFRAHYSIVALTLLAALGEQDALVFSVGIREMP